MPQSTDQRYFTFMFATLAGFLAVQRTSDQPMAPATVIELVAEAGAINPDDLPDDLPGAALDFVEFHTFIPGQLAPDRFHEQTAPERPAWLPELQRFTEADSDPATWDDPEEGDELPEDEDDDPAVEQ